LKKRGDLAFGAYKKQRAAAVRGGGGAPTPGDAGGLNHF